MEKQQTKVTEEELQQITKFQESIQEITIKLGQLALKKLNLDKEEEYLEMEYEKLLQEEKQLGDNLKEKYGEAQINLKTGDIIYP
jgi:hypothetical protein|tara:strand:- start:1097 stop:1351 length:255 start_codon:yes stop_codon:yes gene_type:complete